MQVLSYLLYLVIGSITGTIYGLLFLIQKRGAFSCIPPLDDADEKRFFPIGMLSSMLWLFLRLLLLSMVLFYLLPLPTIPLILLLIGFFVFFGIVIGRYR